MQVEADAIDRLHHAVVGEKLRLQVLDLEDVLAHRFCLGSRASRKPSPRKLNAISVSESAIAGASTMGGEMRMAWKPAAAIAPQDGVGGGTPRPRKLRKASKRMAMGTPMVAWTIIGPSEFGRMWRKMIRFALAPPDRAASTNSRSRKASGWPRTSRAMFIHWVNAIAEMMMPSDRPRRRTRVRDRKSTRLNSSHSQISYAVFCLKKKTR